MKPNHFLIPLLTIAVALMTTYLTHYGLEKWYKAFRLQIVWIWYGIFVLTAVGIILAWNSNWFTDNELTAFGVFIMINAMMNVFWSFLFFFMKATGLAAIEAVGLFLSTLSLMIFAYPASVTAAAMFIPYFLWTGYLIYLSYSYFKHEQ